jgi:hypothetical protein
MIRLCEVTFLLAPFTKILCYREIVEFSLTSFRFIGQD